MTPPPTEPSAGDRIRSRLILACGLVLTVVSFAGSYTHCVEMVERNGQTGAMAFVIAAMPEVSVLLCGLAALSGRRGPAVYVVGGSSFAFTIVANGSTASPGALGMVVALWPAWSAIGALWLTGGHTTRTPPVVVDQVRPAHVEATVTPVEVPAALPAHTPPQLPAAPHHDPAAAPAPAKASARPQTPAAPGSAGKVRATDEQLLGVMRRVLREDPGAGRPAVLAAIAKEGYACGNDRAKTLLEQARRPTVVPAVGESGR